MEPADVTGRFTSAVCVAVFVWIFWRIMHFSMCFPHATVVWARVPILHLIEDVSMCICSAHLAFSMALSFPATMAGGPGGLSLSFLHRLLAIYWCDELTWLPVFFCFFLQTPLRNQFGFLPKGWSSGQSCKVPGWTNATSMKQRCLQFVDFVALDAFKTYCTSNVKLKHWFWSATSCRQPQEAILSSRSAK